MREQLVLSLGPLDRLALAKLMSDDATILEHLGDVYVALDIPQKAKELYTRALAIDDENVEGIRRKLARLRVGGS